MMLKEAEIISLLHRAFPMHGQGRGIGDDAAVIPVTVDESLVITKDILVENVHFRLRYGDAASVAHKALHVNLSDIAAMGAKPELALLGVALPRALPEGWVQDFLCAFADACKAAGVRLIGGDTTASERDVFISVTMIGRVPNAHIKLRSTAKTGDVVCVVGALGEARAGLELLEKNIAGHEGVKVKSLRPMALTAEGLWLGQQTGVTAMMDVSDGLLTDTCKLLESSEVGGRIDVKSLTPSPAMVEACALLGVDPLQMALAGGEDYALLVTLDPQKSAGLMEAFEVIHGKKLIPLGPVLQEKGLKVTHTGDAFIIKAQPYSHFGEL